MTKRKATDFAALNKAATSYAQAYLKQHAMGLPADLSEEAFGKAMDAIFAAIGSAYVSGYLAGRES